MHQQKYSIEFDSIALVLIQHYYWLTYSRDECLSEIGKIASSFHMETLCVWEEAGKLSMRIISHTSSGLTYFCITWGAQAAELSSKDNIDLVMRTKLAKEAKPIEIKEKISCRWSEQKNTLRAGFDSIIFVQLTGCPTVDTKAVMESRDSEAVVKHWANQAIFDYSSFH